MRILAVDTCTEPGSLALLLEGGVLDMEELPSGWHSTTLHEKVLRLLGRHGLTSREISGYGVTAGPGAFTGVRIGLTAVKGLAEAHGKPMVSLSTLETLAAAAQAVRKDRSPAVWAPLLDARRGQIFGAVYRLEGEQSSPAIREQVCPLNHFLEQVKAAGWNDLRFCGMDREPFWKEVREAGWNGDSVIELPPRLAGALAQITLRRLEAGRGIPALAAEANYVRASDAELFWKE